MVKYGIDHLLHGVNSEEDLRDLILWTRTGRRDGWEGIDNLITRDPAGTGGAVRATASVWHGPELDYGAIPPGDAEWPFVNRTLPMRTTAGCAFSCAFCSYPEVANGFHQGEIDAVERQLATLLRVRNVNRIIFLDDTPNIPKPRWQAMCRMFRRHEFEWFSFLRVQYVDDELARLMKESGCRGVYLGLESANDQVLKNMNKKATRAKYLQGVECLKRHGITTMAAFVLGFPGETGETIGENVRFIEESGVDFFSLKEFYYLENTPIHQQRERFGLTGSGGSWTHDGMDADTAYRHKLAMFGQIRNSVFIDPDTSLWYLAYLYDQGFSMSGIATLQKEINTIMADQMAGRFADDHPGFRRIADHLTAMGISPR